MKQMMRQQRKVRRAPCLGHRVPAQVGSIAAALLAASLFTACQSTKVKIPDVPPLALLQSDSLLYVAIPVKVQKDLAVTLIHSVMPSIPEATIEKLAVRCDTLYGGIGSDNEPSRLEIAVKGDFPLLTVGTAFSEKNGWAHELRTYDGGGLLPFATNIYSSESMGDMSLAFPTQSILCASRSIDTMMQRYAPMPEVVEAWPGSEWIGDSAGGMRFYVSRPVRAIKPLQGTPMENLVDAVYGSVEGDGEDVSIDFFLRIKANDASSSSIAASALVTLLRVSLMKAGINISQSDDYTVKVAGMKMKASALAGFLGAE